jgi:hypothetical protein
LFEQRLEIANDEMIQDLRLIQENAREAIVIVASDHGPFLTGDCLYLADRTLDEVSAQDLADRYGALLAVRWPESSRYDYAPPAVLQDLFFSVFAYLLDAPAVLEHHLPHRTFGYGRTLGDNLVVDGVITAGRDRGKRLFGF